MDLSVLKWIWVLTQTINTSSQDSKITPTSLVANSSLSSPVQFLVSASSTSQLMKKQSSSCLSLPESALPLKLPQKSYTHMLLNHYECVPNTKPNNIPPSATLPSPPPPDRTTQSVNPRINFDYNEKDRISNYTNHFPHQSVSVPASCGNPLLPKTSTPNF